MKIKRFIFDLDGTLLTANYKIEKEYFEKKYGEEAYLINNNIASILDEYEKRHEHYNIEKLSTFMSEKSGLIVTPEIIEGWMNIPWRGQDTIEDGILTTLKYLKENDKSIAVLTNWFGKVQIPRLKNSGIYEFLDDIYTGEVCLKPHKKAYFYAKNQFTAEECLVIGDNLEKDYIGPRSIGMNSVLYDKRNHYHDSIVKIKSMDELRKKY